jgi:hypothetical protein
MYQMTTHRLDNHEARLRVRSWIERLRELTQNEDAVDLVSLSAVTILPPKLICDGSTRGNVSIAWYASAMDAELVARINLEHLRRLAWFEDHASDVTPVRTDHPFRRKGGRV